MMFPLRILQSRRTGDAMALRLLEERAFAADRLSLRSIRRLMNSPSARILAAHVGGALAGAVILLYRSKSQSARIYSLAVDPAFRRQGIARRLMNEVLSLAAREGKTSVHLEVRAGNECALRLYSDLGFTQHGERPGYYEDGSSALRMRKRIAAPVLCLVPPPRFPRAEVPAPFRRGFWGYQTPDYYEALIAEARGGQPAVSTRQRCDAWVPGAPQRRSAGGSGLAILHDPGDPDAPSNLESILHVRDLAAAHGVRVEIIAPGDLHKLPEFGALWIRSYTSPQSISYVFARHAEELGLAVLDSSASIRHCGNKVFMAERLRSRGIPMPRTLCVDRATSIRQIEAALAYPVVLKAPDGAFSKSVSRADSRAALELLLLEMLNKTAVVVAQDYIPTDFDWRIGLLEGEPLYACQYYMVRGHWQVLKHIPGRKPLEGRVLAVPLARVPPEILQTAVAASRAMGTGLHGVDLKQTCRGVRVIEVNDNPDLNLGYEDLAEGEAPWLKILSWFQEKQFLKVFPENAPRAMAAQNHDVMKRLSAS